MKSFIKWVGGKQVNQAEIFKRIPEYENFVDMCVGGGSIILNANHHKNLHINDLNSELIAVYKSVRDEPSSVFEEVEKIKYFDSRNFFYQKRKEYNNIKIKKGNKFAALFIYLNKASFNGLYRINKKGFLTSTYGFRTQNNRTINTLSEFEFIKWSKMLSNIKITNLSMFDIEIKENTFYYIDPPYFDTFSNYNKNNYNSIEQILTLLDEISNKGSLFLMSNSIESSMFFEKYNIEEIFFTQNFNKKNKNNGIIKEILVSNYKKDKLCLF